MGSLTLYALLPRQGCDAVYTSVGVTPGQVGGDRVDEGGAKMKTTSLPSTYTNSTVRPYCKFSIVQSIKKVSYTLTLLA